MGWSLLEGGGSRMAYGWELWLRGRNGGGIRIIVYR